MPRPALAILGAAAIACCLGLTCASDRPACSRDGDCDNGQVCYQDGRCASRASAQRRGKLGLVCAVREGVEVGCRDAEAVCRLGFCIGPAVDSGPQDSGSDARRDGAVGDASEDTNADTGSSADSGSGGDGSSDGGGRG